MAAPCCKQCSCTVCGVDRVKKKVDPKMPKTYSFTEARRKTFTTPIEKRAENISLGNPGVLQCAGSLSLINHNKSKKTSKQKSTSSEN